PLPDDGLLSASMTPTRTLPARGNPYDRACTEKLASQDATPSPAGTVALADVVPVELPHAAAMIASAPAPAINVKDLSFRTCLPSCFFVPLTSDELIVRRRNPDTQG